MNLQSSQIVSKQFLHQCFASTVLLFLRQNMQFRFSLCLLTTDILSLFWGRPLAHYSFDTSFLGAGVDFRHTGHSMVFTDWSPVQAAVLDIYVWMQDLQNVWKHGKSLGSLTSSKHIGQRNLSRSIDGLSNLESAIKSVRGLLSLSSWSEQARKHWRANCVILIFNHL